MIWLYRLLFLPALVIAIPVFFRQIFQRGGFAQSLGRRLGGGPFLGPPPEGRRRVWVHAVSVGEMLAIAPVIERLAGERGLEVCVTATTTTGYAIGCERYGRLVRHVGYFPLDFWPCSVRAWRRIRPDAMVLAEAELWPEHLHQAARRGVPVAVVNARVSDRSMARLRRAPWLARRLWGKIARVTAASQEDGERIAALGFPRDRLDVCGNLKFDAAVGPVLDAEARERLRHELGLADGPVLMGSSTWPGEEEALLAALGAARAAGIGARLLVVPRHAERRGDIADVLERSGFSWHLRSRGPAPEPVDVCLADTTGEMVRLLQAADVVFIGRSLPPNDGGQTPVESAALGKAMIFGPNMTNFRSIARALVETGGATLAQDAGALAQDAVRLLRDPAARAGAGRVAQGWHGRSRGAVERTIEVVRTMAGLTPPERAAAGAESTRRQTRP